jgi:hypothetical protein
LRTEDPRLRVGSFFPDGSTSFCMEFLLYTDFSRPTGDIFRLASRGQVGGVEEHTMENLKGRARRNSLVQWLPVIFFWAIQVALTATVTVARGQVITRAQSFERSIVSWSVRANLLR